MKRAEIILLILILGFCIIYLILSFTNVLETNRYILAAIYFNLEILLLSFSWTIYRRNYKH
jgi:hypothetical protein